MTESRAARPRGSRLLVAVGLLVVTAGLFGVQTARLWSAASTEIGITAEERAGVAYLHPLTRLIGELAATQSIAVAGGEVDGVAVSAARDGVARADLTHGGALRTSQRWSQVRVGIDEVLAAEPTGAAALEQYREVLALATDLVRVVGDTSQLLLDPELDAHHLMDAAVGQVPQILVESGRAADLAGLAAASPDPADPRLSQLALGRYQVAEATDTLTAGLAGGPAAGSGGALGENLTVPLDDLRVAVDQFAPPVALVSTPEDADPEVTAGAAERVREAGLALGAAVLAELDTLLADRADRLADQRVFALVTALAGVLVGLALLWWTGAGPIRPADRDLTDPDAEPAGDVAAISVRVPLMDARELVEVQELLHVGRGVQARPKDRDQNAG